MTKGIIPEKVKCRFPGKSIINSTLLLQKPLKVCNLDYLIQVTRGNTKAIHEIASVFLTETKEELDVLNDAVQESNYAVIANIAHKIKSAFLILGISSLGQVFKDMEMLSINTSSIAHIKKLTHKVNMVFEQAQEDMKF